MIHKHKSDNTANGQSSFDNNNDEVMESNGGDNNNYNGTMLEKYSTIKLPTDQLNKNNNYAIRLTPSSDTVRTSSESIYSDSSFESDEEVTTNATPTTTTTKVRHVIQSNENMVLIK